MDVDEVLASSIEKKLCPGPPFSSQASIFRVPPLALFQQSEGAFAPNIVSIGPFHHGDENLKSMEEVKSQYLHGLLSRASTPLETRMQIFTKAIRQLEASARQCYAKDLISLEQDEFVKMMIIDGCFILELFRKKAKGIDDLISSLPFSHVQVDLILFENQIPWFVLECLFDLTELSAQRNPSPAELALGFFDTMMPMTVLAKSSSRHETKHLLDLLWNSIISGSPDVESTMENKNFNFIPSVTILVEAGVKFKKGNPEEILNIRFEDGVMEIPPLLIQGSTERLFQNLIAYEQCSYSSCDKITSYVVVLDSLINSPKDMHLLWDQGILKNMLGTEEDASLFFKRVWKCSILHKFYYVQLCKKVKDYLSKNSGINGDQH